MNQQLNKPTSENTMESYDKEVSSYFKAVIFEWCLVAWIYAAFTWHVLWPPGILIFFPGILIAAFIAALFFIPLWFIKKSQERLADLWKQALGITYTWDNIQDR
jgi:hypothetical protein